MKICLSPDYQRRDTFYRRQGELTSTGEVFKALMTSVRGASSVWPSKLMTSSQLKTRESLCIWSSSLSSTRRIRKNVQDLQDQQKLLKWPQTLDCLPREVVAFWSISEHLWESDSSSLKGIKEGQTTWSNRSPIAELDCRCDIRCLISHGALWPKRLSLRCRMGEGHRFTYWVFDLLSSWYSQEISWEIWWRSGLQDWFPMIRKALFCFYL